MIEHTEKFAVDVSAEGSVSEAERVLAHDKFAALVHRRSDEVRRVQVRLAHARDRANERPYSVEAVVDLNGRPVRAHVAARHMGEAIDLAADHLRRRIVSAEARWHRLDDRSDTGVSAEHEWRHGDMSTHRPPFYPRPVDEREIVRRKSLALEPMTIDEAVFDLEQLGHSFYMFMELTTRSDCVVMHAENATLTLLTLSQTAPSLDRVAVPVTVLPANDTVLSVAEARQWLDATTEPFVFFRSAETGRGGVLYRRYDGHYGLITPE